MTEQMSRYVDVLNRIWRRIGVSSGRRGDIHIRGKNKEKVSIILVLRPPYSEYGRRRLPYKPRVVSKHGCMMQFMLFK